MKAYRIKMLIEKHSIPVDTVLFVHPEAGFKYQNITFKPWLAKLWIASGIAEKLEKERVRASG
jgi:hypothetical protein